MRRGIWTVALACLLAASGCKKETSSTKVEAEGPAGATSAAATAAPASSAPSEEAHAPAADKPATGAQAGDTNGTQIVLVSPGAEPRTELRYKFRAGRTKKLKLSVKTSVSGETAGQKMPASPPIVIEMFGKYETVSVDPDGTARRKASYDDVKVVPMPGLPPGAIEQVEASLAGFKTLKMTETVSSRGVIQKLELDQGTPMNAQLKQIVDNMKESMSQAVAPLPVEPVGKGGKWKSEGNVAMMGTTLRQTGEFELISLVGDLMTTKVTLTQKAEPGPFAPPGAPAGVSIDLVTMESKGSGEQKINLATMSGTMNMALDNLTHTAVMAPPGATGPGTPAQKVETKLNLKTEMTVELSD